MPDVTAAYRLGDDQGGTDKVLRRFHSFGPVSWTRVELRNLTTQCTYRHVDQCAMSEPAHLPHASAGMGSHLSRACNRVTLPLAHHPDRCAAAHRCWPSRGGCCSCGTCSAGATTSTWCTCLSASRGPRPYLSYARFSFRASVPEVAPSCVCCSGSWRLSQNLLVCACRLLNASMQLVTQRLLDLRVRPVLDNAVLPLAVLRSRLHACEKVSRAQSCTGAVTFDGGPCYRSFQARWMTCRSWWKRSRPCSCRQTSSSTARCSSLSVTLSYTIIRDHERDCSARRGLHCVPVNKFD